MHTLVIMYSYIRKCILKCVMTPLYLLKAHVDVYRWSVVFVPQHLKMLSIKLQKKNKDREEKTNMAYYPSLQIVIYYQHVYLL